MSSVECDLMEVIAGSRLDVLRESYARLTGSQLAADAMALWHDPRAIVAHDTSQPPVFFYANRTALTLFRMVATDFLGMPSALSAEPDRREERAAMLARLELHDIVTGYNGIRIAADGTRFAIKDAVIWNLRDEGGTRHGQAALITEWDAFTS